MVAIRQQFFFCDVTNWRTTHVASARLVTAKCDSQLHGLFQAAPPISRLPRQCSCQFAVGVACVAWYEVGQATNPIANLILNTAACRGMLTLVLCPSAARSMGGSASRRLSSDCYMHLSSHPHGVVTHKRHPPHVPLRSLFQADSHRNFSGPS